MKSVIAGMALVGIALAGCGNNSADSSEQSTQPQTSVVTVHVSNQAGIPVENVTVVSKHLVSAAETPTVASDVMTDADGNAAVTLPENITAQFGLHQGVEIIEDGLTPTWQTAFVVPSSDVTLWYTYPTDILCGVVDPTSPTFCLPEPTPTPTPTSSESWHPPMELTPSP